MRKIFLSVLLSMVSVFSFSQLKNGYDIDITIRGLEDSTVFLAYHLGDKQYINDTVILDKAGHGRFTGKEVLPQGIYMIVLPGKKYFEILMSDDQYFGLNCSFNDYFGSLKFTGSNENSAFIEYQKKWITRQQHATDLANRVQTTSKTAIPSKSLHPVRNYLMIP